MLGEQTIILEFFTHLRLISKRDRFRSPSRGYFTAQERRFRRQRISVVHEQRCASNEIAGTDNRQIRNLQIRITGTVIAVDEGPKLRIVLGFGSQLFGNIGIHDTAICLRCLYCRIQHNRECCLCCESLIKNVGHCIHSICSLVQLDSHSAALLIGVNCEWCLETEYNLIRIILDNQDIVISQFHLATFAIQQESHRANAFFLCENQFILETTAQLAAQINTGKNALVDNFTTQMAHHVFTHATNIIRLFLGDFYCFGQDAHRILNAPSELLTSCIGKGNKGGFARQTAIYIEIASLAFQ